LRTVVFSFPGREADTLAMLQALERQNPGEAVWLYRSSVRPSIEPFYEVLRAAAGDDVLFLEDDIITARNFIRYAARWASPHVTSFFHVNRPRLGEPVPAAGFSFAQAVKLPAPVIAQMLAATRRLHGGGHDDEIGWSLAALGLEVVYHRSLVQHVGAASACWGPEVTLAHRAALDFPGEGFDCLRAEPADVGALVR
jgi:hypothetical protein